MLNQNLGLRSPLLLQCAQLLGCVGLFFDKRKRVGIVRIDPPTQNELLKANLIHWLRPKQGEISRLRFPRIHLRLRLFPTRLRLVFQEDIQLQLFQPPIHYYHV